MKRDTYKNKIKRFLQRILILFTVLSVALVIYIVAVVNPVLIRIAEAKVNADVIIAVNKAISEVLTSPLLYSDIVQVHKSSSGNITMLQANSLKVNDIAKNTAAASQKHIDKISGQIINVPAGSATGAPILIGIGPDIAVRVMTAGSVRCEFKSEFQGAGINQTRHKIFIEVIADMELILPISSKTVSASVQIFISEAVLLGDVPQFYFGRVGQVNSEFVP